MGKRYAWLVLLLLAPHVARAASSGPVTFKAADGVTVHGVIEPAQGAAKGVILLFHQASSSHAEYAPIAPELAKLGWTSLAIDQRSGGSYFGGRNETAAALGRSADYLDALPDLEAALAYAKQSWPGTKILAWGSSYSAALVFLLAEKHPGDLAGLLSFSPGEYLSGASVRAAAAKVTLPIYVTSAADSEEVGAARAILAASPSANKVQYAPKRGIHGSATLRADSDPEGAAENWAAVKQFLARF